MQKKNTGHNKFAEKGETDRQTDRQTEERVHVPVEVSVHVRWEGTIYAFLMLLASIRGHQRWPRLIFPLCVKTPPGEEYIHV